MVEIYYLNTDEFTELNYVKACAVLSKNRVENAGNYKFEKNRFLSIGTGVLLDYALNKYGLRESDLTIIKGKHGKPYIKDSGVYFNLSHSGKIAVCAVAETEVGIDVEEVLNRDVRLIKKVTTAEEYERLLTFSERQKQQQFTRLWTVKESFVKYLGAGLSIRPNRLCVDFSDPIKIKMDGVLSNVFFKEFEVFDYKLTVCCGKEKEAYSLKQLNLKEYLNARYK